MEKENQGLIKNSKQITVTADQIECNPLNDFDISDLDEMQNDLMLYGLINPIAVIGPSETGKYMLISGERRITAIRKIREKDSEKFSEISANVVGPYDMDQSIQKLLIDVSNISVREHINVVEKRFEILKILFEMKESEGLKNKDVIKKASEFFKVSRRYARMYAHVFIEADESLKEKVIKGEIPVDQASKLSYLDKDLQKKAAGMLDNGSSVKTVVESLTKKEKPVDKKDALVKPVILDSDNDTNQEQVGNSIIDKSEDTDINVTSKKDDLNFSDQANINCNFDDAFDDIDDDDDFDYDEFVGSFDIGINNQIDTTGSLHSLDHDVNKAYTSKLNAIMNWCNTIKVKDELLDEEWDVLNCMREVVDKFF